MMVSIQWDSVQLFNRATTWRTWASPRGADLQLTPVIHRTVRSKELLFFKSLEKKKRVASMCSYKERALGYIYLLLVV